MRQCYYDSRLTTDIVYVLARVHQVWLHSYKMLFSVSCHKCSRLLVDNVPPTWRDFQTLEAYHEQCRP